MGLKAIIGYMVILIVAIHPIGGAGRGFYQHKGLSTLEGAIEVMDEPGVRR